MLYAQPCAQPIITGGAATYCTGLNTGFVFVDNRTDSLTIIRWESALQPDGPFYQVGTTTQDTLYFSNLTQTTYYRAFARRKGCAENTHSPRITITIDQPSVAGNIQGSTSACALYPSGNLTLTGYQGSITTWLRQETGQSGWTNFGTPSAVQSVSNITQTTNFRAVVTNGVCPADTSTAVSIQIDPNPVANFTFNPVCLGDAINFSDASTVSSGYIANYSWAMGDGSTAAGKYPTRKYLQPGTYDVTLAISTDKNCRHETTKQVEVYHLPTADFSAAEVCLHDSTVFRNLSSSLSGEITSWDWDFADFTTSSEKESKHLFTQPGDYQVRLFVRTEYGCRHNVQKTIKVNEKPIAAFEADTVCLGNTTAFNNLSSVQSGYIYRQQWSFGDGTTGQQPYPNKTYQTAGDFLVKLTVESEKQCKDTGEHWVHVRMLPIADFSANEVCDGETTFFQNHSIATEDSIVKHQWNFGDGAVSSDNAPSRLYLNPETYTVSLLVRTANGCEHQTQKQAIVHKTPIADFSVQNVCIGNKADFVNLSFIRTNESLYHQWNLGDGNETQLTGFQHTYENSGDYNISLKVTSSAGGCADSTQRTIRIYPLPHIYAGEDVTTGRGISAQLSASGGLVYHWFPATGLNNSTSAYPMATLSENQTYTVRGTDAFGCENTDTVTVFIIDDQRIVPTNFVTPGSENNQSWIVQNIENYPEAKVVIFDIHGRQVYTTINYQNDWDGRNQSGETLPDGTYYYIIHFPKDNRTYKGAILVLRKK